MTSESGKPHQIDMLLDISEHHHYVSYSFKTQRLIATFFDLDQKFKRSRALQAMPTSVSDMEGEAPIQTSSMVLVHDPEVTGNVQLLRKSPGAAFLLVGF